ncbi:3'-5' exonuclease [Spartinivicinus poritis]|uniref:3'-5' exonuclease n=1 Tax=Spartinivicinus poritis TaxID=2994640 RepID=A0ABT5U2X5_9GAMM|nr:3'-5' exonuclease [Spartinivicinus sp. A2-2]MDE1460715.1 3'-5' exonuclease [Spartinivicinus sp. A2-2]
MADLTSAWQERYAQLQASSQDERLQRFYAAGMVAGNTPINSVPLVALDFETTGLDAEQDDIVSIGLVPFTLQRIFCRDAAEWIVKPVQPLAEESVIIHGITHSEVNSAPDLQHFLEQVLLALAGKVVVVHYRQIECNFFSKALLRRIGESIQFPVIDTLELEQRALRARQGLVGRLLQKPMGSVRLADCRKRYSLPYYHPHHAMTDALATAELLQAQVAHHYRSDTPVAQLWN